MKKTFLPALFLMLWSGTTPYFYGVKAAEAVAPASPGQRIWYHTAYPGGVAGPPGGMSALTGPTKMPAVFEAVWRGRLIPPERLHTDSAEVRKRAPAAPPIDLESLRAVHTDRYLKAVFTGEPAHLALSQGLPFWNRRIARGWLLNAGGLAAAAEAAVRENTITGNIGHGYHHATAARGMGFCTINGLLTTAHRILREGTARRVMILDLDQHEGNGTGEGVIGDSRIEHVSIYGSYMGGPGTAGNNHVFRVEHGAFVRGRERDANYLAAVASLVPELLGSRKPDLVLYQAGMDPFDGAGITPEALAIRDAYVFALCRARGIPAAWVLAGGYADMETLVRLHTGTVRAANEVLARVRPGRPVERLSGDPYGWEVRRDAVIFPDWSGALTGPPRMTPRPGMSAAEIRDYAAGRLRTLREERLPDGEIRAAYEEAIREIP
jgi:acetoin utilization deacetylase AcuC-like enzyme